MALQPVEPGHRCAPEPAPTGPKRKGLQVAEREGRLVLSLMPGVAESFVKEAYSPRREVLALDLGPKTLFAGESPGAALAHHRQPHGLRGLEPTVGTLWLSGN